MWRTVARLEWRILRRDRAALAVLVLFAAFLVLAAFAGGWQAENVARGLTRAQAVEAARDAALRARLVQLETSTAPLSARDPRDPVWMGQEGAARLALLPPAPLAAIAVGQRDLRPQAVRVNTGAQLAAEQETETPMSGPTRLTTGAFDPAFLFVVLFPLVVIALSYELLSGERERGTLAMLLSQPVSQIALVVGKAGARLLALSVVTLAFALIGLLVAGADLGAPGAGLPIALYAAVLVAWAAFWFAAAIAVNAWGRTSASNALVLVGLWLVVVVVVPGLVNVAMDTVYPAPSRVELVHETREVAQAVEKSLADLQGRHDRDTRAKGFAARVVDVQEALARRSAPLLEAQQARARQRQEMLDGLRFLSPAIMVQLALEDVAGSGGTRHERFETQVAALHDAFRGFFVARVRAGEPLRAADVDVVPSMVFEEEAPAALLWRVTTGLLGLLVGAGLLLAIAWPGLRRVGRLAG